MKKLYKTTVVIWSDWDPSKDPVELEDLAHEATCGDAYCSKMKSELVDQPDQDPDWDGTEFFMDDED